MPRNYNSGYNQRNYGSNNYGGGYNQRNHGSNNRNSGGRRERHPRPQWLEPIDLATLNTKSYVEKAETLMETLKSEPYDNNPIMDMTTTKLRSLLTLINRVEDLERLQAGEKLSDALIQDLLHAQIRFAYESAREPSVREFLELSNLLNLLKEVIKNGSKEKFELLARYFESLVAYHRFFGGRADESDKKRDW